MVATSKPAKSVDLFGDFTRAAQNSVSGFGRVLDFIQDPNKGAEFAHKLSAMVGTASLEEIGEFVKNTIGQILSPAAPAPSASPAAAPSPPA